MAVIRKTLGLDGLRDSLSCLIAPRLLQCCFPWTINSASHRSENFRKGVRIITIPLPYYSYTIFQSHNLSDLFTFSHQLHPSGFRPRATFSDFCSKFVLTTMTSNGKASSVELWSWDMPAVIPCSDPPPVASLFIISIGSLRCKAYLVDPALSLTAFCLELGCRSVGTCSRIFLNNGPIESILAAINPIWDNGIPPRAIWQDLHLCVWDRQSWLRSSLPLEWYPSQNHGSSMPAYLELNNFTAGLGVYKSLQVRKRAWVQHFAWQSCAVAKMPARA